MLHKALIATLDQVETVLDHLDSLPRPQREAMFTASRTGTHLRHIYDHISALLEGVKDGKKDGVDKGLVDYNRRHRNSVEERDVESSRKRLAFLRSQLRHWLQTSATVTVVSEIDCTETINQQFESSVEREMLYLINHTLHHLAYVSLALTHAGLELPSHIGLAPSTASFLREELAAQCAH